MKEIINYLKDNAYKVSTMESCTGGFIANAITNIEGASEVFQFGAVTYSNEYKIKLGVEKEIIEKYTVYSTEVSKEMSKAISSYTNSSYGIGITGKLNKADINNPYGNNNEIYISIYDNINNIYYTKVIFTKYQDRYKNKEYILEEIIILFKEKIMLLV